MTNNTTTMPALPPMPGARGGARRPCACGCGRPTGGTWYPGHDGRAHGWATRIAKGVLTIDDVPANERAGAERMRARAEREHAERTGQTAAA